MQHDRHRNTVGLTHSRRVRDINDGLPEVKLYFWVTKDEASKLQSKLRAQELL